MPEKLSIDQEKPGETEHDLEKQSIDLEKQSIDYTRLTKKQSIDHTRLARETEHIATTPGLPRNRTENQGAAETVTEKRRKPARLR